MSNNGLNQEKVEAFTERIVGVLNNGALALMCSIGHRTGLFDTLAQIPPATSAQIAEAAGLNERYVREWLNIIDCFHNGRGIPYTAFHRFHEVMAEDSNVNIVEPLVEQILPLVPGLSEKLERGSDVLDLGCGRGNALKRLAQTF